MRSQIRLIFLTALLAIGAGCGSEDSAPSSPPKPASFGNPRSDPFYGTTELAFPSTSGTMSLAGRGPVLGNWAAISPYPHPVHNVTGPRDLRLWSRSIERSRQAAIVAKDKGDIAEAIARIRLSQIDYHHEFLNRARFHTMQAQEILTRELPEAVATEELLAAVQSACRKGRQDWTMADDIPFHATALSFFKRVAGDKAVDDELRADAQYRLAHLANPLDKPTPNFASDETHSSLLAEVVRRFPDSIAAITSRFALLSGEVSQSSKEECVERTLALADEFAGTSQAADALRAVAFDVTANIPAEDSLAKLNRVLDVLLRHAGKTPESVRIPRHTSSSYRPPVVTWAAGLQRFEPGFDVSSIEEKAVRFYAFEPMGSSGLVSQLATAHSADVPRWADWFDTFWDRVEKAAVETSTTRDELLLGRGVFFMSVPNTTGATAEHSIKPLTELVVEHPDSPLRQQALDLLACLALREGRLDDAVTFWRTLAADDSNSDLAAIATWDAVIAAQTSSRNEATFRETLRRIPEAQRHHPVIAFLVDVETGYSWAREGDREKSRTSFQSAIRKGRLIGSRFEDGIQFGLKSYRLGFLQALAEEQPRWWQKVVRNIVESELYEAKPQTADEAIEFYSRMVDRFPDPSGRESHDYRQGHFFTLIKLLVGNGRLPEAYRHIVSVLDRWNQRPDLSHPEAELMLRLWKLRLEFLGTTDGKDTDRRTASVKDTQVKFREILQDASVVMLPDTPLDPVGEDVESLAELNPSVLDPRQIQDRTAADLQRPWYFCGPTGWTSVELHDGSIRHFLVRPPVPDTDANVIWIPDGRFFETTPLDTGDPADEFRNKVVRPVLSFTDPQKPETTAADSTADAPAPNLDSSSWYRVADSIGQINRITFYDESRTRVCVSRNPDNRCQDDSTCRQRHGGAWKNTTTEGWYIWK